MDDLMTTSQAAAELGLEESHVRRLVREQKIAGEKKGHDWLVYREAVEAYKTARRKPGPVPVEIREKNKGEKVISRITHQAQDLPVGFFIDANTLESFVKTLFDLRGHDSRVRLVIKLPSDHNMPEEVRTAAERLGFDVEED